MKIVLSKRKMVIFGFAALFVGFQNCSKVYFNKIGKIHQARLDSQVTEEGCEHPAECSQSSDGELFRNCSYDGKFVVHGESVESYESMFVPVGKECKRIQSICVDGSFAQTPGYVNCEVGTPPKASTNTERIILPSSFSLNHMPNERTFTVSWKAGLGNGGLGGCKLEYKKGDFSWVTLRNVNCDADGASVGVVTLPGDGWHGGPWSVVPVRITDGSGSVIGHLGDLSCRPQAASLVSTPHFDEDCNGTWDDRDLISCIRTVTADGQFPTGKNYSVPEKTTKMESQEHLSNGDCSRLGSDDPIPFHSIVWYKLSNPTSPSSPGGVYLPITSWSPVGKVPLTCGGNYICSNGSPFLYRPHPDHPGVESIWSTPGDFHERYMIFYKLDGPVYR